MRKILVTISLLVMLIFLVSCAPAMTDEELEAELAKLTPEEREELLADLESKEGGALAGQAFKAKYVGKVSSRAMSAPVSQVKKAISKAAIVDEGLAEAYTPKGKATQFCKTAKVGDKTHYCTEAGSKIEYDRFRCASKPSGNIAVTEIDTTYEKSLLDPKVNTCAEILAQFLDKSETATIGCTDSDGGNDADNAGYIEFVTIQTGNKAPSAPSAVVGKTKEKEVDACDPGFVYYNYETEDVEYIQYEGGYPGTIGYVEPPKPEWSTSVMHLALFERRCPALFENAGEDKYTKIVDCPYEKGSACYVGRCIDPKKGTYSQSDVKDFRYFAGGEDCIPAGKLNCKELWNRN